MYRYRQTNVLVLDTWFVVRPKSGEVAIHFLRHSSQRSDMIGHDVTIDGGAASY